MSQGKVFKAATHHNPIRPTRPRIRQTRCNASPLECTRCGRDTRTQWRRCKTVLQSTLALFEHDFSIGDNGYIRMLTTKVFVCAVEAVWEAVAEEARVDARVKGARTQFLLARTN